MDNSVAHQKLRVIALRRRLKYSSQLYSGPHCLGFQVDCQFLKIITLYSFKISQKLSSLQKLKMFGNPELKIPSGKTGVEPRNHCPAAHQVDTSVGHKVSTVHTASYRGAEKISFP